MELNQGKLGAEGEYDVKLENGKLSIGAKYEGALAGASVEIHVGGHQVLQAIKDAIPGEIDNMVIDVLEAALLPK